MPNDNFHYDDLIIQDAMLQIAAQVPFWGEMLGEVELNCMGECLLVPHRDAENTRHEWRALIYPFDLDGTTTPFQEYVSRLQYVVSEAAQDLEKQIGDNSLYCISHQVLVRTSGGVAFYGTWIKQ